MRLTSYPARQTVAGPLLTLEEVGGRVRAGQIQGSLIAASPSIPSIFCLILRSRGKGRGPLDLLVPDPGAQVSYTEGLTILAPAR